MSTFNLQALTVDIALQAPAWEKIDGLEKSARAAVKGVMDTIGPECSVVLDDRVLEISIVFANDSLARTLNREYRGKDTPTNVLSFPAGQVPGQGEESGSAPVAPSEIETLILGDVILAYETIEQECRDQGKYLMDHILHLLVHGLLHLLNYNHETEDDALVMETLEIRILEKLGVQNPYTDTNYVTG